MPRKILIIEDEALLLKAYCRTLEDLGLEILTASTLLDALEILKANPDVELIAVDGCFPRAAGEDPYPEPGYACSGEKFIANARYRGPILACSSEASLNARMVMAGATFACEKGRAVCQKIRELLAAPPAAP
jgi:CheY-like chemotaxis protein